MKSLQITLLLACLTAHVCCKAKVQQQQSVAYVLQSCFYMNYTPNDNAHRQYDQNVKNSCGIGQPSNQPENVHDQLEFIEELMYCAESTDGPTSIQAQYGDALECAHQLILDYNNQQFTQKKLKFNSKPTKTTKKQLKK